MRASATTPSPAKPSATRLRVVTLGSTPILPKARQAPFVSQTYESFRADVLRLRSLAQRGRAGFLPSTTRHYDYAYIRSLQFLVRCPPEIAWHVLGYWRCQYTPFIGELGVH